MDPQVMDSQIKDNAWLAWIEQLAVAPASDDREHELPRSLFHCRLDDQPDHLVPERLLQPEYWEGLSGRPLFLNPTCAFTANGDAPADGFASHTQMLWIKDPANDTLQPFWLGPELGAMLSGAQ